MSITYIDAVKAQIELEEQIFADPNVVSVGVIAEIDELGESTGDYVIKVGVISVEEYKNSVSHENLLIPKEYMLHQGEEGQERKCVRIQVVKTEQIKPLSLLQSDNTGKNDFPSAVDGIPVASRTYLLPNDPTSRRRPSPGGYGIGHPTVTAGTFGLLLEYEEGIHANKAFILSNNHVIAVNNLARVGDAIARNADFARNLRVPATKYGTAVVCIVVAATMGMYESITKQFSAKSSDQSKLKTDGILNRALTSCGFFKTGSSIPVGKNTNNGLSPLTTVAIKK